MDIKCTTAYIDKSLKREEAILQKSSSSQARVDVVCASAVQAGLTVEGRRRGEPTEFPIVTSVPTAARGYHRNFLEYLALCWSSHSGIVIAPDMIWFHVMSEIASHVKGNAEHYRSVFTTAAAGSEKTNILMQTDGSPTIINIAVLMERLRALVPSDVSKFSPTFSTTTPDSRMAVDSAFCEALTPYYSYSMMMCGFPAVLVLGDPEDWEKLGDSCDGAAELLDKAAGYLRNTAVIARDVAKQVRNGIDPSYWSGIFSLVPCGSGSQVEVDGWVTRLYMEAPRVGYVSNFPTHITRLPFDVIDSPKNRDYVLSCGLMYSTGQEIFLVPHFGWVLNSDEKVGLRPEQVAAKCHQAFVV